MPEVIQDVQFISPLFFFFILYTKLFNNSAVEGLQTSKTRYFLLTDGLMGRHIWYYDNMLWEALQLAAVVGIASSTHFLEGNMVRLFFSPPVPTYHFLLF